MTITAHVRNIIEGVIQRAEDEFHSLTGRSTNEFREFQRARALLDSTRRDPYPKYRLCVHKNIGSIAPAFDWVAYDDLTYDGRETDPIGYGSTAQEAIDNLLAAMELG